MPKQTITRKEARKYLSNVKPEQSFWINNGPIINNLRHLSKAIEGLNSCTFRYHVNQDKNDFSNWIKEVIGDLKLAEDLRKIRTKEAFVQRLKRRLQRLKKIGM